MAEDLDDGEFWLPSEFLGDDMFKEKRDNKKKNSNTNNNNNNNNNMMLFSGDYSYGFGLVGGSASSSPVESVVGSTETESDEEDYMAGLTQQMAHSTLQDDNNNSTVAFTKNGVVAGSPQSTLCTVGSLGSSRGSSNGPSQVSSPPSTPLYNRDDDDAWDLLYAAAGQVVRMKLNDEALKFHGRGVLGLPKKLQLKSNAHGFYPNQPLTHQQLRIQHFQQLKEQQMLKQQQLQQQQQCLGAWGRQGLKGSNQYQNQYNDHQIRGGNVGTYGNGRNSCGGRALGGGGGGGGGASLSSSAWPSLHHHHHHQQQQQQQPQQQQQQPSSGMRAVFLGGSGTTRESSGTGVFLPRTAGAPDLRKKPACSTVLLPARVVQALNLNLDEMGTAQPRFQNSFIHDQSAMFNRNNSNINSNNTCFSQQERLTIRPRPTPTTNNNHQHHHHHHEIHLPREWTY